MDSAGSYVVAWQGYYGLPTGHGGGIYAQRYNAAGTAEGGKIQVDKTTSPDHLAPSVAMDAAGDFVVAWVNYDGTGGNTAADITGQRYNAVGVAQGSEFQIGTAKSNLGAPVVAMDAAGDFAISWENYGTSDIYVQRYNSSATAQGSSFIVNTVGTAGTGAPSVAMDAAGAFIVAWTTYDSKGGGGIVAQRYNAAGTAQGSELSVYSSTVHYQPVPGVAMDATGDFVVAWLGGSGSSYGMYARKYSAAGTAQESGFKVSTSATIFAGPPLVAMDAAGDFIVAWTGDNIGSGNSFHDYGQYYNAAVIAEGGEFQINTNATGFQFVTPSVAMDSAGDFVAAWQSYGTNEISLGIDARRYAHPVTVNHAPAGTPKTVVTLENTAYAFKAADFGFTDPNDKPPNTLLAVKITTLPLAGSLDDNGVAVVKGATIPVADITAGKLKFTPATYKTGATYASFTFQVQDNGGTANGGVNTDPTARKMTVSVTPVTQAPAGTSKTVTTLENKAHTFATADFGFTDPHNTPANTLTAVKIATLPGAGTLADSGVKVTAGKLVSVADINSGKLVFTPASNANGVAYAKFTFQVQDNGSTTNGGVNLDPTPRTISISVTPVTQAPVGTSKTVTMLENKAYTFATADFGFTDPHNTPVNTLTAVKIATLPGVGTLADNGVKVTAGQSVPVADITGGKLKFTPVANGIGAAYAHFTFQVQDSGSTTNGGVNTDPTPRTITVAVTAPPPNHAPAGTSGTVTTLENKAYAIKVADFGFRDPNDNPSNGLLAVKFTLLSTEGTLTDNGVAVTVNQFVSASDISAGKLVFAPKAHLSGGPYFLSKFQVEDNGGTANGGVNLDPTAKVLDIEITHVNQTPVGAAKTVTTAENTAYVFKIADFGFSDPNDTPPNALLAVRITTLPLLGSLTDNGVALAAGAHVSATDIAAGKLKFTPKAKGTGTAYASFTFQVQDNGGTSNGGIDTDPNPKKMTINVT